MTDSATLRAMAEEIVAGVTREYGDECFIGGGYAPGEALRSAITSAILSSKSSWAKEKAELVRQLAEVDRLVFEHLGTKPPDIDWPWHLRVYRESVARHRSRHASRPVAEDRKHPSHVTRFSDSSLYDEVCINCGATDNVPGEWGELAKPCPVTVKE